MSDEMIQQYIDGELNPEEVAFIEQHLKGCNSCTARLESQRKLSKKLKSAIDSIVDDNIEIPAFETGKKLPRKTVSTRKPVFVIASMIAAACLVLFFVVFRNGESVQTANQISSAGIYPFEPDANQPLSGQPLIIHVAGPDGNQIDYIME
jgi:anti-sigma factor RsiW